MRQYNLLRLINISCFCSTCVAGVYGRQSINGQREKKKTNNIQENRGSQEGRKSCRVKQETEPNEGQGQKSFFFFSQFEVHWVPYDFQENGFTRKISNKLLCKALDGSRKSRQDPLISKQRRGLAKDRWRTSCVSITGLLLDLGFPCALSPCVH